MKKIGRKLVILIGVLFSFNTLLAKESIQVVARANPSRVLVGQPFILTLQVLSNSSVTVDEPVLPDLSAFDLVGSWNSQSTSSRLVQGPQGMEFETQKSMDFNYQLIPQNSGGQAVGSFKVQVDGKTYSTKPVQIEVTLDPSLVSPPTGADQDDEVDEVEQMFNQMLQRHRIPTQPKVIPRNLNDSFFIHLEIDKKEAYVGEQITVSWYLFTKGQILGLDRLKFPDLKGFWKEIIEEVPALNFTPEVINGVMYRKALLASHALFPIKEGISVIDEYKVKATVQVPTQSFGGLSYSEPYSYQRSSDRVEIKVKAIPKEGQPLNFSGAVGFFDVIGTVSETQVPINQPFALTLRFEGQGNAKLIDLPEVQWPEGLEYFDQKSEARFFKNGRSFREFEVLLIPRKNGEIEIPSFNFSFFDPERQEFYEKHTQSIKIQVSGEVINSLEAKEKSETAIANTSGKVSLPPLGGRNSGFNVYSIIIFLPYFVFFILVVGLLLIGVVFYLELLRANKKQSWKEYLDARVKLIEKRAQKMGSSDVATLMTQTLSKLIGAASQQGANAQEFEKLLDQSPPSLQVQIGSRLKLSFENLEQLAYAPKSERDPNHDLKEYLTEFKDLSYKILTYLEA